MNQIRSSLVFLIQVKDISIGIARRFMAKQEPVLRKYVHRALNNKIVERIIAPNIEDMLYCLKVAIRLIELLEIICGARVFGTIYDDLTWRIVGTIYHDDLTWRKVNHTFCIWLGAVSKCYYGIHMSFLGLMVAMYSLTLSFAMDFMELPPCMIFRELDLNAFRLGLWWVLTHNLFSWLKKKSSEKYAPGRHRPFDRIYKMSIYHVLIGSGCKRVRKMWRWTITFICINLVLRSFQTYLKSVKKNIDASKKNIK